ncbi:MAG TPA: CBS domain-containing protein [Acidimicrobiia bacterium]|nr:CBS domain-containing protein [Acidimicrobiia bacterium]
MSPRAAARLAALGFDRVFDYVDGKKDWIAAGLPVEGEKAGRSRALALTRREVPTCRPRDTVEEVRTRGGLDSWGYCVVVDEDRVVHGLLRDETVSSAEGSMEVEHLMELGPTTLRPTAPIETALERMESADSDSVLITTPLGELLGILFRADLETQVDIG